MSVRHPLRGDEYLHQTHSTRRWGNQEALRITIYSMRHTYATMALHSGVDLRTLQKRMGHSDLRTTMEYLRYIEPEAHPMDRLPY